MLRRMAAGSVHPCLGADPVALAQQLHCQNAGHASHGPAGVNQLSLLEPAADVCWGGQTCRGGHRGTALVTTHTRLGKC